jgi:hypothetical protein
MLPPVHFYLDDSGTRVPDRKPTPFDPKRPNHFSLGGVLVLEEDEVRVRAAHAQLCDKWRLTYPLHSVDIRAGAKDFSWLRRGSSDYEPFMHDPYEKFSEAGTLIEAKLSSNLIPSRGTKYSCFQLVDESMR